MNPGKELEHQDLTDRIIGCAIEIHKRLGPGFIESIYENAFTLELQKKRVAFERQKEVIVEYDGIEVGKHRLDIFVEGTIVVELKAIRSIEDIHFAIVRSYLKALGKEHGLLINFSQKVLEVKRVIFK